MIRFSKNKKTNAVYNSVFNQLLEIHDTHEESIDEIEHYYKEFKSVYPDFNLVQYGNLLCYYADIRELFSDCGYSVKTLSDARLWENYKRVAGIVARFILKHKDDILNGVDLGLINNSNIILL